MDFKKVTAPNNTLPRDFDVFEQQAGSIYAAVNVIAKRADQISIEIKEELSRKLEEYATQQDNLEEVFENREQIDISRFYERLAKPVAIATDEFERGKVSFRVPDAIQP